MARSILSMTKKHDDSWTNDYIEIPFAEHGRAYEGLDCYGLLYLVYQDLYDLLLPEMNRVEDYKDTDDYRGILTAMESKMTDWVRVLPGQEREGDVINLLIDGWPVHIGIIVRPGTMLHIMKGANVTREPYRNAKWKLRTAGFYRHKDMA